jgi:hypothetical protein
MRRIIDFMVMNGFKYWVKKNEALVFFEIFPCLIFKIKSPDEGPYQFSIHKAILWSFALRDHLIIESKNQDEIIESVIKLLKYPHLLKKELRKNFEKFEKVIAQ